ncbi:MAG: hypothetical protein ACLVIY_09460 [Anaerobutyricum soehngenii]
MAQVTSQHGLIYSRLAGTTMVWKKARMYFQANELAIQKYRELSEQHLYCDFEETSSYVYSKNRQREALRKRCDAASRIGRKAEFCESNGIPFDTSGAVRFQGPGAVKSSKIDEWSGKRYWKSIRYR